jgi:hypothetical protein
MDALQVPKAGGGRLAGGRLAPVWAGSAILIIIAVAIVISSRQTEGRLVYSLDDPYIHMSMARNLVEGGAWGVNPGEFTGASSSPLWTLLVAGCFRVIGPRDSVPLVLNLLVGAVAMAGLWALLRRYIDDRRLAGLLLFAVAMALPMPMLVICGMEHTLEVALVFGFTLACLDALGAKEGAGWLIWGAVLAALLVGARFEGLFLVFSGCALLVFRGRWKPAVLWGACAWIPVGLYAVYSVRHGGAFFPNSVLLKGSDPSSLSLAGLVHFVVDGLRKVLFSASLGGLVVAAVGMLLWLRRGRDAGARDAKFLLWLFLMTALLHGQFAATGWSSRYEAYLIGLGAVAVCAAVTHALRTDGPHGLRYWAVWAAAAVAAVPLGGRGLFALRRDCIAPGNIYQQHCQMAFFVRDHYAGKAVAANDIGAITWYGGAHVIDLWGLANREVFQARRAGTYTTAVIRRVCDDAGVEVAVVYPDWFRDFGGLPPEWRKIGTWTIPHNIATAGPTVTFYSTGKGDPSEAARRLRESSKRLPPGVRWTVEGAD